MMSPGSARRKPLDRAQRRAWRTHQRLLDAGFELFVEKGLDAISIHDITEHADVGKGSFYRHFADKNELKQELIGRAIEELLGRLERAAGWTGLPQAVESLLQMHLEFFHEAPGQFALLFQDRLLIGQQQAKPDELAGPYQAYVAKVRERLAALAGAGLDEVKVRQLLHAIAGFISGHYSLAVIGLNQEQLRTQLEPFRRGFVAAAASFLISVDNAGAAMAASPAPGTTQHKETTSK